MKPVKYKNFPFDEVCATAAKLAADGWSVHQKFSCAGCGQRLTMPDAGKFYDTGTCDKCNTITDIRKTGCNYLLTGRFPA